MGSLNATGISVVSKDRGTIRNIGGAITTNTGRPVQGAMGVKTSTQQETSAQHRTSAQLGTQPDRTVQQYSTMRIATVSKVATSDDSSLDAGLISRDVGVVAPDADNQPEISNKPVSQRSTYHTGGRTVVSDTATNTLVSRNANTSFAGGA